MRKTEANRNAKNGPQGKRAKKDAMSKTRSRPFFKNKKRTGRPKEQIDIAMAHFRGSANIFRLDRKVDMPKNKLPRGALFASNARQKVES